jgi:hypothetical protein
MTNYDIIISKEHKYLIYLVDELAKRITYFDKITNDRDVKLSFLLNENLCDCYHDTILVISKIKKSINDLDINNLNSGILEGIGAKIDSLASYIEYFEEKCKTIKV